MMEREIINVTSEELYDIVLCRDKRYEFIKKEFISSDYEDGGVEYMVIIKRDDGKFFKFFHNDWDVDGEFKNYENPMLTQVFERTILMKVYE